MQSKTKLLVSSSAALLAILLSSRVNAQQAPDTAQTQVQPLRNQPPVAIAAAHVPATAKAWAATAPMIYDVSTLEATRSGRREPALRKSPNGSLKTNPCLRPLSVTDAPRASRLSVDPDAFTVAEIRCMSKASGRYLGGQGEMIAVHLNTYRTMIAPSALTPGATPSRALRYTSVPTPVARQVPLLTYLKQLNIVEAYLRKFNRSLREPGGGDMGVVAKLRKPNAGDGLTPVISHATIDTTVNTPIGPKFSTDWKQPVEDGSLVLTGSTLSRDRGLALLKAVDVNTLSISQLDALTATGITQGDLVRAGLKQQTVEVLDSDPSSVCPSQPSDTPPQPKPASSAPPSVAKPKRPDFVNNAWYQEVTAYENSLDLFSEPLNLWQGNASELQAEHAAGLASLDNPVRPDGFNNQDAPAFACAVEPATNQTLPLPVCVEVVHNPISTTTSGWSSNGYQLFAVAPNGVFTLGVPALPASAPNATQQTLGPPWLIGEKIADLVPGSLEQRALAAQPTGSSVATTDGGQKSVATPTFLYDGILNSANVPSYPAGGSPYSATVGPFGVNFVLEDRAAKSEACTRLSHRLDHFNDVVGTSLDVSVFGAPISILDFHDAVDCTHENCTDTPVYKLLGENISAFVDNRIDGPSAVIPIGPIPIALQSFVHYSVGPQSLGSTIPFKSWSTAKGANAAGQLGASVGLQAEADAGFSAGLDLLVASAGVEAGVTFIDTNAGATITTTIAPDKNLVSFDQGVGVQTNLLGGYLDAFVEVDLLVWSKRWTIELFRENGFPINDQKKIDSSTFARAAQPMSD